MMGIRTSDRFSKLRDIVEYIYDPRVGLITEINEHAREAGGPDFFRYVAMASDTRAFAKFENFSIGGGGASLRDAALAKAIGEAVERYSSAVYSRDDFPIFSYRNAALPCVPPKDFALYVDEQFSHPDLPYQPFHEDSDVRWAPAKSLVSGANRYVPACFVYLPYLFPMDDDEWPIAQSISTGLACHGSYELAAAGGICEVIERDCFSITWQAMVPRERIRHDSLLPEHQSAIRRFREGGYDVHLMDISHDNEVPTVLTVLRGRSGAAAPLAVAAATDLDPVTAVRKSLEELAHTERYVRQIMAEMPRIDAENAHSNVYSQVSHVNFWTSPDRAVNAEFLYSSEAEKDLSALPDRATGDPERDLAILVDQIAGTGHDVLVADVTSDDIRELGLSVVRSIVPGYHPLCMGYATRALGGQRIWDLPAKLGFPSLAEFGRDNPFPHPFP